MHNAYVQASVSPHTAPAASIAGSENQMSLINQSCSPVNTNADTAPDKAPATGARPITPSKTVPGSSYCDDGGTMPFIRM